MEILFIQPLSLKPQVGLLPPFLLQGSLIKLLLKKNLKNYFYPPFSKSHNCQNPHNLALTVVGLL